jgi:hypothetical protein
MQTQPNFRKDLVANPVIEGDQRFVDVTDPDSGSTFRFYEVEYAVACAMDGTKDLSSLISWSNAELGLAPSSDEIELVVTTLDELGYLAAAPTAGDFELGASGKSPLATPRPPVEAVPMELGKAGTSGPIETSDGAVSVGLEGHLEDGPTTKFDPKMVGDMPSPAATPAPSPEFDDEAATTVQGRSDSSPSASLGDASDEPSVAPETLGAQPIEIPSDPPPVAASPTASTRQAPAKAGGSMTVLVLLLVAAVLGAAGWWVYANVLNAPAESISAPAPQTAPAAPQKKN